MVIIMNPIGKHLLPMMHASLGSQSSSSPDLPFEAESAPNPQLQNIFYASLKVDLCSSIWVKTEHSFLII